MPDDAGTFERVAEQLAGLLEPVTALLDEENVLDTLAELGVAFPEELLDDPAITAARETITGAAEQLVALAGELTAAIDADDVRGMTATAVQVVAQCVRLVAAFGDLATALSAAGPALPGVTAAQVADLVADLPRKLLDLLLLEVLELSPPVAAVLTVFGVVERAFVPGEVTDPTRPDFDRVTVRLDRLLTAVTDPVGHLADLYGWGGAAFDALALLTALETALARLGLPVLLRPPDGAVPPVLEAFAVDVRPTADAAGLRVEVVLPGSLDLTTTFPVSPPTWTADVRVAGTAVAGTAAELRPPLTVAVTPPAGAVDLTATVALHARPDEPFVVLGQAGGSRLEFRTLSLEGGIVLHADTGGTATATPTAEGGITGGRLVLDASGGDGFLTTLLGGGRVDSTFDVGFAFAPDTGLRFSGSGGIEIQLPVHVQLGPLEVQAVYVVGRVEGAAVPVELSAALAARLGVLDATVDRIGVIATLGFPPGGGNLGPADLALRLQAAQRRRACRSTPAWSRAAATCSSTPTAASTPARWSSTFADFLALKAIGLITTRMPDGSPGLLAAGHHHRGVRHRHPARLRLHAARRRRPARPQPHDATSSR